MAVRGLAAGVGSASAGVVTTGGASFMASSTAPQWQRTSMIERPSCRVDPTIRPLPSRTGPSQVEQ